MFVEERQDKIIDLLHKNGRVRVKDLSQLFQVTEDLIRKDLTSLEEKGLLKRTYGGAVLVKTNIRRESAGQRKDINIKEKQLIAKKAKAVIVNNNVVFLDISTVNIEVAYVLAREQMPCTVVTNMVEIMQILAKAPHIKLFFVGGELDYGQDGFVGDLANEIIKMFKFDVAFMGVVAIDVFDNAVYTYMPNDGITKQHVLSNSKLSFLLCEQDKFNQNANFKYAKVNDCDAVITGNQFDDKVAKQLKRLGVKMM